MLATLASQRGIELLTDLPELDLLVAADRNRILQVLSNLVGNALKFTPSGGRVTLSVEQDGEAARFCVSDTGTGIPDVDLPRIFERFWHGREGGGTGLGLAISRGIVEVHGGRIWVESGTGGSTFT